MPDPGIARARRMRRLAGILCLALAAAAAAYLLLRGSWSPAPEKQAAAPPVPTGIPAAPVIEAPTALTLPVVVVPTPPRIRRAAAPAEAPAPVAGTSGSAPNEEPSVAPPAPHPPRPAASRSYAGSVTLPGGEKIELGGIAWSEEEPRALLNDRIVGVGGYVSGYSVSKIETDRVVLEKDGATLVLTVK
jgi:hypothetical protein